MARSGAALLAGSDQLPRRVELHLGFTHPTPFHVQPPFSDRTQAHDPKHRLSLLLWFVLVTIHRTVLLSFATVVLKVPVPIGESLAEILFHAASHFRRALYLHVYSRDPPDVPVFSRIPGPRVSTQQAELQTLKTQLHPHFLFNTLNAIAALVYVSPPEATKTISQLSDLLRFTFHNNKAQEVTLKEELDFLRKYLQIQQTLLQERREVEWAIDPETLDALVPNMIWQPLVENSIRHGIAPKEGGGRIEIFSGGVNDQRLIEIRDDGMGAAGKENGTGIGLINSRTRLEHLYGEAQKFDVKLQRTAAGA